MKKLHILAALMMGLLLLASCDTDRDDNPTLTVPKTFTLNAPGVAANNVIDLANTSKLRFAAEQPNYGGMPLPTTYRLWVSMDSDFTAGACDSIHGTFVNPAMEVDGSKINGQVVELYKAYHKVTSVPNTSFPLYVRCVAQVTNQPQTTVTSNVVKLNVCAIEQPVTVTHPENIFICGSTIGTAWTTWQQLAKPFGTEGQYYYVAYMTAGGEFKWGLKEKDWHGLSEIAKIDDQAGAGVSAGDGDNIKIAKAGWYTFKFTTKISSGALQYTLSVFPAKISVIGSATGGFNDANKIAMTAPADNTGDWVSQPFTGAGELRMFVDVPGLDWWRTEFTIMKSTSKLFFRDRDIPNNWQESLGEDYSNAVTAGQTVHLNFVNGTGKVQ